MLYKKREEERSRLEVGHDSLAPAPGRRAHCRASHYCRPSCSNISRREATSVEALDSPRAGWRICRRNARKEKGRRERVGGGMGREGGSRGME